MLLQDKKLFHEIISNFIQLVIVSISVKGGGHGRVRRLGRGGVNDFKTNSGECGVTSFGQGLNANTSKLITMYSNRQTKQIQKSVV